MSRRQDQRDSPQIGRACQNNQGRMPGRLSNMRTSPGIWIGRPKTGEQQVRLQLLRMVLASGEKMRHLSKLETLHFTSELYSKFIPLPAILTMEKIE